MAALGRSEENRTCFKIRARMEELGMSIRDFSDELGITYEHSRRINKGLSTPPTHLLKPIAKLLNLKFEELEASAVEDRIRAKYGSIPEALSLKNPELAPIEAVWDDISEAHKKDLVTFAKAWANADRATRSK